MIDEDPEVPHVDRTPAPYEQLDDEPNKWYVIFTRYYLLGGVSRTIRKAYVNYLSEELPDSDQYKKAMSDGIGHRTGHYWYDIAQKYRWKERALAWDKERTQEYENEVKEARLMLMNLTPDAVDALKTALGNARLTVQAAKEILDRAGLPAVKQVELDTTVQFSSDEMAEARKETEDWEKTILDESG